MSKPEPCTTWSYNRQHLSADLHHAGGRLPGREGHPLCGVAQVYDQERMDWWRTHYGPKGITSPIPDLPLCRRCAKKAGL